MKTFLVVTIFTLLSTSSALAEPTFRLACRGGGSSMLFDLGPEGIRLRNRSTKSGVSVVFKPAAKGLCCAPLEPGECAWIDRPLNSREPKKLCLFTQIDLRNVKLQYVNGRKKAYTFGAKHPRGSRYAGFMRALNPIGDNKAVFFEVYNNNKGCLVVTDHF